MSLLKILKDTTRKEWIQMSHCDFVKNIVETLNMMRNEQQQKIINKLTFPQFEMLTRKCWDEQDQPLPDDCEIDDETVQQTCEETLPIIVLLENILSIRIETELNYSRKENMAKQLALLNIILQPHLFEGIAKKINDKNDKKK